MQNLKEDASYNSSDDEVTEYFEIDVVDLPPSYWEIQKLLKFAKVGNENATVISLCALKSFDYSFPVNCQSILDANSLDVLFNLLLTHSFRCQIATLRIFNAISDNFKIQSKIFELNGISHLLRCIRSDNIVKQTAAVQVVFKLSKCSDIRHQVYTQKGIATLTTLLETLSKKNLRNGTECYELIIACCNALWNLSKSEQIQIAIYETEAIEVLANLLNRPLDEVLLLAIVGILENCSSTEARFQKAITSDLFKNLIQFIDHDSNELRIRSINTITNCAELSMVKEAVIANGGLDILVQLLLSNNKDNKLLITAIIKALWMCSKNSIFVKNHLVELKAIEYLTSLCYNQSEHVLNYSCGTLGECADLSSVCSIIRKQGALSYLCDLLASNNTQVVVNATITLKKCMADKECLKTIEKLDCIRKFWSGLKHECRDVQSICADAISYYISLNQSSGDVVRGFVGGLELAVKLLEKNSSPKVQASICRMIANIASNDDNLQVLSDLGIETIIIKMAQSTDMELQKAVALAISRCCQLSNIHKFTSCSTLVATLVSYMNENKELNAITCLALHQLSYHPLNCVRMYNNQLIRTVSYKLKSLIDIEEEIFESLLSLK